MKLYNHFYYLTILIFLLFIFLYDKYKNHSKYESVIHPYLWSCPFKNLNNLYNSSYKSQFKEDYIYNKYFFRNKLNGIYVELGALDGVRISNTYFYEHFLGWSGILIEGSINSCYELLNNQHLRPRSQIVCSAICKNNEYIEYKQGNGVGGITGELPSKWFGMEKKAGIKTKCSNIGNILKQFHISHIDFFSLDVEGSELSVLETFDFSIVVNYWVIEFNSKDENKNAAVRRLLKAKGYIKCKIELQYNECYEYPHYQNKIKKMITQEDNFRTNFGTKCI